MSLVALQKLDRRTAEGVLAAAALGTAPISGVVGVPQLLSRYSKQADDVLSEIRARLRIPPNDDSAQAHAEIDKFLSDALQGLILNADNRSDALKRVGQSGRLPPALYRVIQSQEFKTLFVNTLGMSSNHIDDAVRRPDDHQHLMPEGLPENARTLSLFLKKVTSGDARKSHWLLVNTNRAGLDQIVLSAWRIYPADVDLSGASQPIDVLRAFAEVFGYTISVGDKKALFVDAQQFPPDAQVKIDWTGASTEHFVSFSQTRDVATNLYMIGLAYCIDIAKYRTSLKRHGVKVKDPTP
jgi:hypothetical protein